MKSAASIEIADGVFALFDGLLYLAATKSLIAADIHFGYEELIGGALPLWSIPETVNVLGNAIRRTGASEVILLGDVVHGSRMSETSARRIADALTFLRTQCRLTIIAGNHEGRSRGVNLLGETHEDIERAGWLLTHGDSVVAEQRCIIGHLHPSVHLAGNNSAPAFLYGDSLIVVPALTPYSIGLDICSPSAAAALRPWLKAEEVPSVCAIAGNAVYPCGSLDCLKESLSSLRGTTRLRKKKRLA